MSPQRIQRQRTRGWRMPEGAVYVGRGTLWGNPYRITAAANRQWRIRRADGLPVAICPNSRLARQAAVDLYRTWLEGRPDLIEGAPLVLAGRDLACWCPTDAPCHADVLLAIANEEDDQ